MGRREFCFEGAGEEIGKLLCRWDTEVEWLLVCSVGMLSFEIKLRITAGAFC